MKNIRLVLIFQNPKVYLTLSLNTTLFPRGSPSPLTAVQRQNGSLNPIFCFRYPSKEKVWISPAVMFCTGYCKSVEQDGNMWRRPLRPNILNLQRNGWNSLTFSCRKLNSFFLPILLNFINFSCFSKICSKNMSKQNYFCNHFVSL